MKGSLFCFLTVALSNCFSDKHKNIELVNNSEYSICAVSGFGYPDTLSVHVYGAENHEIKPHESSAQYDDLRDYDGWEYVFNRIDTLMIFVLDYKGINANDGRVTSDMIWQRYDLSLDDLEYLEWKLTYPPTPAMRYIKMYPPYEE